MYDDYTFRRYPWPSPERVISNRLDKAQRFGLARVTSYFWQGAMLMASGEYILGPTYDEMARPECIDGSTRDRAAAALHDDELNPVNLFNIHWKTRSGGWAMVFPRELTGLDVNIIVLLGNGFPSGSHKVGPAYSMLAEACVDGKIRPDTHTILGPSTGNFGIGTAYVSNLMGFRSVVIMPDTMSKERYERIKRYGGELDLTPGTESDVILTLRRTLELMQDPSNYALAQFESFANYRFHRHVTGPAAVEAAAGVGNGRVACFVSAPGSAGTLAAGDHIKSVFPDSLVAAVEPYECSTLSTGGRGQHRVEGIGDKMCILIHNVLNTDFIIAVHDDDAVRALKVVRDGARVLEELGLAPEAAAAIRDQFGVSGLFNDRRGSNGTVAASWSDENIVTVATDGFDRYQSVVDELDRRSLETTSNVMHRWIHDAFDSCDERLVHDCRRKPAKQRLFAQKEADWVPLGWSLDRLESLKHQDTWEAER